MFSTVLTLNDIVAVCFLPCSGPCHTDSVKYDGSYQTVSEVPGKLQQLLSAPAIN